MEEKEKLLGKLNDALTATQQWCQKQHQLKRRLSAPLDNAIIEIIDDELESAHLSIQRAINIVNHIDKITKHKRKSLQTKRKDWKTLCEETLNEYQIIISAANTIAGDFNIFSLNRLKDEAIDIIGDRNAIDFSENLINSYNQSLANLVSQPDFAYKWFIISLHQAIYSLILLTLFYIDRDKAKTPPKDDLKQDKRLFSHVFMKNNKVQSYTNVVNSLSELDIDLGCQDKDKDKKCLLWLADKIRNPAVHANPVDYIQYEESLQTSRHSLDRLPSLQNELPKPTLIPFRPEDIIPKCLTALRISAQLVQFLRERNGNEYLIFRVSLSIRQCADRLMDNLIQYGAELVSKGVL